MNSQTQNVVSKGVDTPVPKTVYQRYKREKQELSIKDHTGKSVSQKKRIKTIQKPFGEREASENTSSSPSLCTRFRGTRHSYKCYGICPSCT